MKKVLAYGMTDNPGGIETYLINIMKELKNEKVRLDFVCDFPEIAHKQEIQVNESKVFFIPAKSKNLLIHWVKLWKVLKEHPEYKTVYFNILDAGAAFTMLIPWIMHRQIVTHSHNGETDKKKLHRVCRPFVNVMTSRYLACSKVASEFMFGEKLKYQSKAIIIPNAIDMDRFKYNSFVRNAKRKELGIREKQLTICHVGRLSMQKNPYGMLDIFKEVLEKEENALLLSVGTGELEDEIKKYAKEIGVSEKVKFMGKRTDVEEVLQASDVFFLPSFYEGLPIVAIEAQTAGLYCVLSKNITREVDITGNVRFLDIEEQLSEWADVIIKLGKRERCNVERCIDVSEFNVRNFNNSVKKLKKILLGEETDDKEEY